MAYAVDAYDYDATEDDLRNMKYYRERLNERPLTTALRSFDINDKYDSTRLPGVYEISQDSKVIYIGGNPCLSNIRDCLNAHFSGNDGLPIGEYLSGPAKNKWKSIFVRWLTCAKPNEVAWFLLSDYQIQHGHYPPFNYPAERNYPQRPSGSYSGQGEDSQEKSGLAKFKLRSIPILPVNLHPVPAIFAWVSEDVAYRLDDCFSYTTKTKLKEELEKEYNNRS